VIIFFKDKVPKDFLGSFADQPELDALSQDSDIFGQEVFKTRPSVLIEEDATTLYVALSDDGIGSPCDWRRQTSITRPAILSIRRELIASVRYLPPKSAYLDCSRVATVPTDLVPDVTFINHASFNKTFDEVLEFLEKHTPPGSGHGFADRESGVILSGRQESGAGLMVVLTKRDGGSGTRVLVAATSQTFHRLFNYWSIPVVDPIESRKRLNELKNTLESFTSAQEQDRGSQSTTPPSSNRASRSHLNR
jgi:hypothetical protein